MAHVQRQFVTNKITCKWDVDFFSFQKTKLFLESHNDQQVAATLAKLVTFTNTP
jgi:5,10-methylene-tetrahydrofolate dehydrogenase/methenyl tetrahydrofolate cyclohydrolase